MSTPVFPAEGVTDTSLTFTAVLPDAEGSYDVILRDAGGAELGREAVGITVTPAPLGTITEIHPGTTVEGHPTTFTVVGTGLSSATQLIIINDIGGQVPLSPAGVTDTGFTFEWVDPVIGTWDVSVVDSSVTEIANYADGFTVVAVPTSPIIFDVWPGTAEPYETVHYQIFGWLLDTGDCLGIYLDGQGGGTNLSGLDFTNTGITLSQYGWSGSPGSWTFDVKAGGSGGTVIASYPTATVIAPIHADSVTPSTTAPGVATNFVITGGGFQQCDAVQVRDSADALVVDCPRTGWPAEMNNTEVAFTATIPTPGVYDLHLTVNMDMGPGIRMPAALTVEVAPNVPTITSVTPNTAEQSGSVATTFTAVGTLLADTTMVQVVAPDGNPLNPPAANVTDTGFTFVVVLSQVGLHDVIALDAGNNEIARRDDAITVTAPPVFTSVTPTSVEATRASTFTVVGTGLAQLTAVSVVEQGVAVVPVTIANHTDTGFTFAWTPTSGQTGVYDLIGDGPGDDALLANAITVNPFVDTTPRIDTVSPTSTWVNHMGLFVVTGYGLLDISEIRIGTSGVGFDDFGTSDFTVDTDTRIEFEGAVTRTGLHDVIGNKQGGTAYLRKDDCLQVNSQREIARGTRVPTRDLEIECGNAAQIVARLNVREITPDITEAWGDEDHATIVCEDDSTTDVTWDGEVWVVWIVVIPGQAVLTRGETKSARELGIGRCAITRAGTAKRLNDAGVVPDPARDWGSGSCAYVLCNTGVHDEVRWNGTLWMECS